MIEISRKQGEPGIKPKGRSYVLMTAAHNEEALIERAIQSVLAQTVLPKRWVIVSDGSTDRTDEIIEGYARRHQFISFLKLARPAGRSYGSKGMALEKGCELLEGVTSEFVGNIDADIAVEPFLFETLMNHFESDPKLGLAAGFMHEEQDGEFCNRATNRVDSVTHAAQLVRRECYEQIGGYATFKYGGEDWYAQQCAKMKGWRAEAIPVLKLFHARHTGAASNLLWHRFRLGRLDYSFGSDPIFEFLKCALRVSEKPRLAGAVARFLGFAWSAITREKRPVSREFVAFLRKEQRAKLRSVLSTDFRERLAQMQGSSARPSQHS
jgi:glycosyltransferase involved in cell wall biosynthesis